MRHPFSSGGRAAAAALVAGGLLAVAAGGCGTATSSKRDVVAGKEAFVKKCGSCHVLARADQKGTTGPNLDEAFRQALADGMKRSTLEGIVLQQILYPNRTGVMPAKLATGRQAGDIAAYVAEVAAKPGEDSGLLATIGKVLQKALAKATGGKLTIPADPGGQLLYSFKNAEAPAGPLEILSPNKSATPHNIAIEGPGANASGPIVSGGGVSDIKVNLKAGKYTFYCAVPGHRQAGMQGTLRVK
jgi:mono/diheme cytochrome c family protein/plastocyanin